MHLFMNWTSKKRNKCKSWSRSVLHLREDLSFHTVIGLNAYLYMYDSLHDQWTIMPQAFSNNHHNSYKIDQKKRETQFRVYIVSDPLQQNSSKKHIVSRGAKYMQLFLHSVLITIIMLLVTDAKGEWPNGVLWWAGDENVLRIFPGFCVLNYSTNLCVTQQAEMTVGKNVKILPYTVWIDILHWMPLLMTLIALEWWEGES